MAHRCEHLCSASQLWLPHPALCVVLPECFWGLRVWSGAVGSKSGKLRNVADRDTLSDHWRIICQVLTTLRKWRLFLKPEKCKFEQKEVEYPGLVISKDHVAMDLTKVCRVTKCLTPMKVKEAQSFLGFVNFYWKFIHDFSYITHPLYALTHNTQRCG